MPLPVIAITNASTCLTDKQLSAAIPALQRQVTLDFRGYWDVDCQLTFLTKDELLAEGWWQISVTNSPDQAGALGYHELTSRGTPLGKVLGGLDLQSGGSWTVTLSHELLEMLADPWINWCAQASDGKIYALEVCDAVEADRLGYEIAGVLVSDLITPSWFEPTQADRVDFKRRIEKPRELASGRYISRWMRPVVGRRSRPRASPPPRFRWAAEGRGTKWERQNGGRVYSDFKKDADSRSHH